jgi:hypothetical protein
MKKYYFSIHTNYLKHQLSLLPKIDIWLYEEGPTIILGWLFWSIDFDWDNGK